MVLNLQATPSQQLEREKAYDAVMNELPIHLPLELIYLRIVPPGTYRYVDRPLPGGTAKIDRRRSISAVDGRLKEKSTVGGQLRKKGKRKKKKRKRRKNKRRRRRKKKRKSTSPASRRRLRVTFLPARGERSRRHGTS
ncbi:hypothetical protein BHE74_00043987 [Ensete ventricosum]|nr:hypothetical protein BHE74_00043987 [Ensete ventricosum]